MHDVPAIDRSILVRSVPLCFSDRHRFLLFSDRVSKLWRPTKDVEGSSSVRLRLFLLFVHVCPFLPASLLSFYLFSFFLLPLPPSRNLEVDARPFLRSFVTSINLDNDQSILLLAFCGVPWLNRDPRRKPTDSSIPPVPRNFFRRSAIQPSPFPPPLFATLLPFPPF